jgi:hypothetical protein
VEVRLGNHFGQRDRHAEVQHEAETLRHASERPKVVLVLPDQIDQQGDVVGFSEQAEGPPGCATREETTFRVRT